VFDGAEDEDDVEGSRLPLLIVLALLVLAMFGGVVWLAYTQGVARGRGETPVLTAANGPERVAPPQGGSNTVPYQGFKIYEQPAPPDDNADAAPAAQPPAPAAAAPKPAPAPPPPALKQTSIAAPVEKPAPVIKPEPVKPVAPKPAPAAAPPKSMAALIQQSNSAPVPAKPVAKAAPAPAKPVAAVPPMATGAPRPLSGPPQTAAAAPAGGIVLQIGSYKSQAEAENAWKTYKAKHTALLSGYGDNIQQVELGEKGTWYRLRVGGFSNREVATALCDRLKADGGACIPGK
jgi:cell division septation protein DedD